MARMRFKKPKIAILMSEVISLTVWLFLGDRIIGVLDGVVGTDYTLNLSGEEASYGCTNGSTFEDAFEILGIGYACATYDGTGTQTVNSLANTDSGLLGVIGLVMCVMILMNFVTYN